MSSAYCIERDKCLPIIAACLTMQTINTFTGSDGGADKTSKSFQMLRIQFFSFNMKQFVYCIIMNQRLLLLVSPIYYLPGISSSSSRLQSPRDLDTLHLNVITVWKYIHSYSFNTSTISGVSYFQINHSLKITFSNTHLLSL